MIELVDVIHILSRCHDELNALEDDGLEARMVVTAKYAEELQNKIRGKGKGKAKVTKQKKKKKKSSKK